MPSTATPTPVRALGTCIGALVVALVSAVWVCASAVMPVAMAGLPFLALVLVGLVAAYGPSLDRAVTALRDHHAMRRLRRQLARLPEAPHPFER